MIGKLKEKLGALIGEYVVGRGFKKAAIAGAKGLLALLLANGVAAPGSEAEVAACILGLLELARNFLKVRFKVPYI